MWSRLKELDLVTMRFSNVRTLLKVVGSKLINLTLEMDDEQGSGSDDEPLLHLCCDAKAATLSAQAQTIGLSHHGQPPETGKPT